ncbi:MAG: nuclear transport factor 2 family protein [Proteobacteria bacterium]|nr:MAG: nuclear transport factor 2 family protein [Pseudomonadota bacterium]
MNTSSVVQPSAATLMARHIELIGTDLKAWLQLLAPEPAIEFPYGPSLGTASRLEGTKAIEAHMRSFTGTIGPFRFTDLAITESTDGTQAWASFHGEAWAEERQVMYRQDYAAFLKIEDGKIKLYREYWNPCHVAYALGAELQLDAAEGSEKS